MASFAWDFEPRNVSFQLTVKATFQPAFGAACVNIPWLDASGKLTTTATSGPLKDLPVKEGNAGAGGRVPPGAIRVEETKDLGSFPVTLDFIRGLQSGVLPISVQVPAPGAAAEEPAKGKGKAEPATSGAAEARSLAKIHLGPLLLANTHAAEEPEEGAAAPRSPPRRALRGCQAAAALTESIGVAGLYRLEVIVSTSEPVLSREMLQRLMPACFTVQAVQGLPNELWVSQKCEHVFVDVYPKLSKTTACLAREFNRVRSGSQSHNKVVRFNEPVVWLLGLLPMHVVREWLMHEGLYVEVHDRTINIPPPKTSSPKAESQPGGDAAAPESPHNKLEKTLERLGHDGVRQENPHGKANFLLGSLLDNTTMQVALRSDVMPSRSDKKVRRSEMMAHPLRAKGLLDPEGIENMEARARVDKLEPTTKFHADIATRQTQPKPTHAGAVCTIKAELAVPIPLCAEVQSKDGGKKHEEWCSIEQKDGESNVWQAKPEGRPMSACRAKFQLPSGEQVAGPWRRTRTHADEDDQRLAQAISDELDAESVLKLAKELGGPEVSHRFERYGRVVLVIKEKDLKTIKSVIDTVKNWNGQVLDMDPDGGVFATYVLSEDELRDDKPLDILTGFGVLDGGNRVFVVEGLRDGGLLEVLKAIPRDSRVNDEDFKMLHHPGIGYSKRLYGMYGLRLKQIKIRMPLEKLVKGPELYSFLGTEGEDAMDGINCAKLVMDLKHMQSLRHLRQGAHFPKAMHLTNLEILFGGYVTDEELAGVPSWTKAKKHLQNSVLGIKATKALAGEAGVERHVTENDMMFIPSPPPPKPRRPALDQTNGDYASTLEMRKSQSMPDFRRTNVESVRQQSQAVERLNDLAGKKRERPTPFLDGQQVFLYSTQRLNSVELQKDWMRKHMDQHAKDKLWTYSPAYMSQSFAFSGEAPPGLKEWTSSVPNDSYANLPGDERDAFRIVQPRDPEEYRKPDRDVHEFRKAELREPFVEGEWMPDTQWNGRPGHQKSHIRSETRFEPEQVPHHKVILERPFDPAAKVPKGRDFGPQCLFESVHYHGRALGEGREEEAEKHNVKQRELHESKVLFHREFVAHMKDGTRHGVTDLDRCETILKGVGHKKFGESIAMPSATIRIHEAYHDEGLPDKEWHARLRENDSSPPFDVSTGTYLKRDCEVGTGKKRATMNGTLGKAPWRHMTGMEPHMTKATSTEYVCQHDFNTTRPPPKSKLCENMLWKSASRTSITTHERNDHYKSSGPYKRPHHFGVSLSMT